MGSVFVLVLLARLAHCERKNKECAMIVHRHFKTCILFIATLFSMVAFASEPTTDWTIAQAPKGTTDWTITRTPGDTTFLESATTTRQAERFSLFSNNSTPLALSLFSPIEVPWGERNVRGLRLNLLYGNTRNLSGLDIGLWNTTTVTMTGWQLGGVNTSGYTRGLQTGAFNCAARLRGLQVGLFNYADSASGLQIGLINIISESPWPFSIALNLCF
jgi:hypothetical protein